MERVSNVKRRELDNASRILYLQDQVLRLRFDGDVYKLNLEHEMTSNPSGDSGDLALAVANGLAISNNSNLRLWYMEMANLLKVDFDPDEKVLEVGSGTSTLKSQWTGLITSDVLKLSGLDQTIDCNHFRRDFQEGDLDVAGVVGINILHHLNSPIEFLQEAGDVLGPGKTLSFIEPYGSRLSRFLLGNFHHEKWDEHVNICRNHDSTAMYNVNQALPYLLFYARQNWSAELWGTFDRSSVRLDVVDSLRYLATGGVRRRIPIPSFLWRALRGLDQTVSMKAPRTFGMFFKVTLKTRLDLR